MALYRERIENAIAPLLGRGYSVVEQTETPQSFGNARIVLVSDKLQLRFTSDRGQLFVDVATPGSGGWYNLSEILRAAGRKVEPGPWDSAAVAVQEFEQHETLIVTLIGDRGFATKLVARR